MDLWSAVRILARRWYLTVPLTVAVLAGAYVAAGRTESEYQSVGSAILIPPEVLAEGETSDFVTFGGSLRTPALALERVMVGASAANLIRAEGISDYRVDVEQSSPILDITVKSADPATAARGIDVVIDIAKEELIRLQGATDRTPARQIIDLRVLSAGSDVVELRGSKTRAALGVAGLGVAVTVLLVLVIDGGLGRRGRHVDGRRRDERAA